MFIFTILEFEPTESHRICEIFWAFFGKILPNHAKPKLFPNFNKNKNPPEANSFNIDKIIFAKGLNSHLKKSLKYLKK